ncbi:hypothetical protein PoB_000445700 [Plakobranchus ocellatus]|uniref:Uncharacterized protein n=1 Tax=Plakobranchus ocellatus TaxID=259542 RepID=A0AAV3Y680_9GAST|nr:hypothetical protein PoB_000445700 [Plakobranchus ocellatus]
MSLGLACHPVSFMGRGVLPARGCDKFLQDIIRDMIRLLAADNVLRAWISFAELTRHNFTGRTFICGDLEVGVVKGQDGSANGARQKC